MGTPAISAMGPFASRPTATPANIRNCSRPRRSGGPCSASQKPRITAMRPIASAMSVMTAPADTKKSSEPASNATASRRLAPRAHREPAPDEPGDDCPAHPVRQPRREIADAEELEAPRGHPERERRLAPERLARRDPGRDPVAQHEHLARDLRVARFGRIHERKRAEQQEARGECRGDRDPEQAAIGRPAIRGQWIRQRRGSRQFAAPAREDAVPRRGRADGSWPRRTGVRRTRRARRSP